MRLVVPVLLAISLLAFAPQPVEAHTCAIENAPCLAACMLHALLADHPCSVYPPFAPVEAAAVLA